MCTITWRITAEGEPSKPHLYIVANRDESRARVAALPPQKFKATHTEFMMPIDPQGQGTWIATNAHGLTVAVLNNYEAEQHFHLQPAKRSRGMLVKDIVACPTLLQAEKTLREETITDYAPFYLLIFAGVNHPICWSWDGKTLKQEQLTEGFLTTSAWEAKAIPFIRKRYLEVELPKVKSESEHLQLLREEKPKGGGYGIAMKRDDAMTVSTTMIAVSDSGSKMDYYAGHPSEQTSAEGIVLEASIDTQANNVFHGQLPWQTRISFDALFAEKAPQLLDRLPRGTLYVLKKVLKEKALNELFSVFDQTPPQAFCDHALNELHVSVQVQSQQWPKPEERPVFVCNHPTGGLDGIVLMSLLQKRYPHLKVAANDVLKKIEHLRPWVVPVNIFGNKRASLKPLQEVFAGDDPLMMFPSGKTARRNANSQLDDGEWSGVPAKLAYKHNRVVVPIHIEAHNSKWFDTIAKWRKKFSVQMNIEMLLLVRELMKPACETFHVHVGEKLDKDQLAKLIAQPSVGNALKGESYKLSTSYAYETTC